MITLLLYFPVVVMSGAHDYFKLVLRKDGTVSDIIVLTIIVDILDFDVTVCASEYGSTLGHFIHSVDTRLKLLSAILSAAASVASMAIWMPPGISHISNDI